MKQSIFSRIYKYKETDMVNQKENFLKKAIGD